MRVRLFRPLAFPAIAVSLGARTKVGTSSVDATSAGATPR